MLSGKYHESQSSEAESQLRVDKSSERVEQGLSESHRRQIEQIQGTCTEISKFKSHKQRSFSTEKCCAFPKTKERP